MRAYLLGALLLLASAAGAVETKYNIFQKGEKVGTLTHNSEGSDADGYIDTTVVQLEQEGQTVKITEVQKYDKEGVSNEASMTISAQGVEITALAALSDGGAKLTVKMPDGNEDGKEIALASETTRKDPTWFWFKTIKPEVGTKVTYQDFDLQTTTWRDLTYEYKGPTKVTIGDKEVSGHELERTDPKGGDAEEGEEPGPETSKIIVDDQGELLVMESGEQKIERILE